MKFVFGCLVFVAWVVLALPVSARVHRFAVIVGNNEGRSSDTTLRYATTDATKVASVLRDLGGFEPANIVLLQNESAEVFRRTLISVNERIRQAASLPDAETLLFVYYSGHADAQALRLGNTSFRVAELSQLVRGSSAMFRMLVVDACRSGSFTRVKGGRVVPPFQLPGVSTLRGEGIAFLTASSANEDAQESDELKGSFFTHAFVSGLRGAADADGNGEVILQEAYKYAYDATLRATSRTFAGTQHPTFHFDVRGQDAVVLTRLKIGSQGILAFPEDIGFLIFRDHGDGPVVGEIGALDRTRSLSLRPGRYFVRGRGADVLFEGTVHVRAGESQMLDTATLRRVEYARLVRKGERRSRVAHGPEAGFAMRTRLPNATTPCIGGVAGYRLELEEFSFFGRIGTCTSSFGNQVIQATTREIDASLAVLRAWDLPYLTLTAGMGGGATLTRQRFETAGEAPDRTSAAPFGFIVGNVTFPIHGGFFFAMEGRAETHFIRFEENSTATPEVRTAFAARTALMIGTQF